MDATPPATRLHLAGDIDLRLARGLDVRLAEVGVRAQGSFDRPEGRLVLSLVGELRELRKVGRFVPPVRTMLLRVGEGDDRARVHLDLAATDAQLARLARAAAGLDPSEDPSRLWARAEWMDALLALEDYVPESIRVDGDG